MLDARSVTVDGISIHAPSRERLTSLSWAGETRRFQSTLPRGSDVAASPSPPTSPYFNPRSLAGATSQREGDYYCELFQSTLPRGSDAFNIITSPSFGYFNPRSLAGATRDNPKPKSTQHISIHAPSRERQRILDVAKPAEQFQSTLPRGSDLVQPPSFCVISISIHAPSRERLLFPANKVYLLTISIHAPSRERPRTAALLLRNQHFNPRSLAGATI